jgi:hypothetical protein
MIFSTQKRFIFFAAGKTGTTSIERSLGRYADSPTNPRLTESTKHISPREVKPLVDDLTWNGMFKFAVVRNPWDWVISAYFFNLTRHERFPRPQLRRGGILKTPSVFGRKQFDEHWKIMKRYTRGTHPENRFQYSFLADEDGSLLVDFVGRFETLQRDFDTICDRIGIPRQELAHANPGQARKKDQRHYTELYTNEAHELVASRYAKDIEFFGYRFDDRVPARSTLQRADDRDRSSVDSPRTPGD